MGLEPKCFLPGHRCTCASTERFRFEPLGQATNFIHTMSQALKACWCLPACMAVAHSVMAACVQAHLHQPHVLGVLCNALTALARPARPGGMARLHGAAAASALASICTLLLGPGRGGAVAIGVLPKATSASASAGNSSRPGAAVQYHLPSAPAVLKSCGTQVAAQWTTAATALLQSMCTR